MRSTNSSEIAKGAEEEGILIKKIQSAGTPPICFKSKELGVLERAMKIFPGRVAVKSDEYGEIAAKEYGALIINQGEE